MGPLTPRGSYDLKGSGDYTVAGYRLTSTAFELNNGGLTASGRLQGPAGMSA
jgi:hypothetical protein